MVSLAEVPLVHAHLCNSAGVPMALHILAPSNTLAWDIAIHRRHLSSWPLS